MNLIQVMDELQAIIAATKEAKYLRSAAKAKKAELETRIGNQMREALVTNMVRREALQDVTEHPNAPTREISGQR